MFDFRHYQTTTMDLVDLADIAVNEGVDLPYLADRKSVIRVISALRNLDPIGWSEISTEARQDWIGAVENRRDDWNAFEREDTEDPNVDRDPHFIPRYDR